jgi:hypothetical protein
MPRHQAYGKLDSLPVPKGPWEDIAMDFITDLPPSKRRHGNTVYDAILVIIDRFTKQAHYIPTRKTVDAGELAEIFIEHIIRHHGVPQSIVSDRGSVFTSNFWGALCYYLRIRRALSTAFHPQTDGQTERQNQTLEQYLRAYTNYQQDDWVSLLPLAEFAYNNSKHSQLGYSPFYALYGYNPRVNDRRPENKNRRFVPAAREHADELKALRAEMANRLREAQRFQALYYDKKHKNYEFRAGDSVWLIARNIRTRRPSKKLDFQRLGPYKVTQRIGNQAYRLELPANFKIHNVFNVNLLESAPSSAINGRTPAEPPPIELDPAGDQFEVEEILDSQVHRGRIQYYLRWKGFSALSDEWVEAEDVGEGLKRIFHEKYPQKPGPRPPKQSAKAPKLSRESPKAPAKHGKRKGQQTNGQDPNVSSRGRKRQRTAKALEN